MTEVVLFDYWRSSASYRVRIGLNLLGLSYRTVAVDLASGEQLAPPNLARNPQGLVPAIEIDGHRLTQSLAILEYLESTRKPDWLGGDDVRRAQVRAIAYSIAMDIHPVCNLRVAQHAVSLGATMEGWMRHFITLGFDGVEGLLNHHTEGRYSHGDTVTLADICLVPQVYNARRWGVDMSAFPRICDVSSALETLSAFRAAHPDLAKTTK